MKRTSKLIILTILFMGISGSLFSQQKKTIPPGTPSKDEILEFLSDFNVLLIDNDLLLIRDDITNSKATFTLKYDRLVVKCANGFETYLSLDYKVKSSTLYPPTVINTISGRVEFRKDRIVAFYPFYRSKETMTKGTLWLLGVTSEDTSRIEKALNLLYEYYTTKDPFK